MALGGLAFVVLAAAGAWLWLRPGAAPANSMPPPLPSPTAAAPATAPATVAAMPVATPTPAPTLAPTAAPTATPAPDPTPHTDGHPPMPALPAPGLGLEARLLRADDFVARGRWAEALAEARAVLEAEPRSARATALAQQAEAELVIEECLRNARLALKEGDRERALEEVRRGFLVRKNDARLMAMHREVVAQ